MATTNFMVQLFTEQYLDSLVSTVYSIDDEAYLFLNPNRNTVIRELACEEVGGMLASHYPGGVAIGFSSKAFTEVRLVPLRGESYEYYYAPSFSPSPAVKGFGLAVLRVSAIGASLDSGGKISVSRAYGAHVYVDQTD